MAKQVLRKKNSGGGFKSAFCYLPEYRWEEIIGFNESDISRFREYLGTVAHIIIELARQGGFENAASF